MLSSVAVSLLFGVVVSMEIQSENQHQPKYSIVLRDERTQDSIKGYIPVTVARGFLPGKDRNCSSFSFSLSVSLLLRVACLEYGLMTLI